MAGHGGQLLVDQLKVHGVTRVFSVPGESFLAALDGLVDSGITNVVCRHEGAAAMMAEATGKLTGRPGVAFVTRGPGASNASAGVHIARQDSTPMVLFVGQIARGHRDREAFQEVDYKSFFGTVAKWVAEVDDADRLPEYINRAFRVAQSGRPGPVVLALPEDMLSAQTLSPVLPATLVEESALSAEHVGRIQALLQGSKRPLVIAGGSGWSAQAAQDLEGFAAKNQLPVAVSFRRQDYINNDAEIYVGDLGVGMNPKLATMLRQADCLLILGSRFGDIPTAGYELVNVANPGKTIIHVHPDPAVPGSVFAADLAITASAVRATAALKDVAVDPGWGEWTAAGRADYLAWQKPKETPGDVKMEQIITWLSDTLKTDSILTNGAGNYAAFLHRYYRFREFGTQVAPTSGSMGYGFPAAIAAKLQCPEKTVVCLAGDGCFQMTLNEMSTAAQYGANTITIVANNGYYGTIRMHQERKYPGRVSGTDMASPDFAALARAYGGHGETVTKTADFAAAFKRAEAANGPAVIELKLDAEALSTGLTLSETRALGKKT
ncbi:MAG: thiamine pyrophosphate-binding protein [Marinosulfonomonas sp.]